MSVERIVMIGPSNIGDALLALETIAVVRARYPAAHLTLVVGARAAQLFAGDPRIQTVVDTQRFDSSLGRVRLAVALWRHHPQVVVDLRHTLYPLLLAPWRLWRYLLPPPSTLAHMRDRHLWKLRRQVPGLPPAGDGPSWWAAPQDAAHVERLWTRWGLNGQAPVVILCPGARSHIKRWSAHGFAAVADRLVTDCRAQVIFSGEPDEEPVIEEIRAAMRQPAHSAVGLTTIRQLGALMQRARLVITNDSASLHLASSVQVPTLAIFGPTDERKYGPRAPRHRVVRRRLFCAPCEQALCRFNHECMRFVAPDEVFAAARELLS